MNFIKRTTTSYINNNINSFSNKIIYNFYSTKRIIRKPSTISFENENDSNPIKRNTKTTKIKNRSTFREVEFENEQENRKYNKAYDEFDDDEFDDFDDNKPTTTTTTTVNNKSTILFKKRTSNGSGILPKGLANNIIKNEWMKRQMTDPYVALAKKDSLISRAAFKLMNINNDLKLFKAGQIVIDLGASPGGWSQYLRKVITDQGLVISVDISPKFELDDKLSFIHGDFTKIETQKQIKRMIQHKSLSNLKKYKESLTLSESFKIEKQQEDRMFEKILDIDNKDDNNNDSTVDIVVSDMAPSYSGIQQLDHSRLIELQTTALEFSLKVLKKGGSFICKVSRGGEEKSFFKLLESNFLSVKSMKPEASRLESTEIYYIGKNYIGNK